MKICIAVAVTLGLLTVRGQAGFVAHTGDVNVLGVPPTSVRTHELESDDFAWVFQERRGFTTSSVVEVNIVEPGFYEGDLLKGSHFLVPPRVIDSFFVHFDPVGSPGRDEPFALVEGTLTFDQPVLGLIVLDQQLWDSERLGLGSPQTLYPPDGFPGARGVDPIDFDFVTLSQDRRTVTFLLAARAPGDQFRVITASAVPEPGSLALWSLGGMGFAFGAGRRRSRSVGAR